MNKAEELRMKQLEALMEKGVSSNAIAPSFFLLAWKLGIPLAPPHFGHLLINAFVFGLPFGPVWTGLMWVFLPDLFIFGWIGAVVTAFAASMLFGLLMASHYWRQARALNLAELSFS